MIIISYYFQIVPNRLDKNSIKCKVFCKKYSVLKILQIL